MKILITGGLGFLGSHLAEELINLGHKVIIIDKLDPKVHPFEKYVYKPKKAKIFINDINFMSNLDSCLNNVEIIYHFAAHQDYENNFTSFIDDSLRSTSHIFESYKKTKNKKLKKIILASSQSIYGEGFYLNKKKEKIAIEPRSFSDLKKRNWNSNQKNKIIKHKEDNINPINFYGWSKKAQEDLVKYFSNLFNIKYTIFRYSIVQGERQSFFNTYSGLCRNLIAKYLSGNIPILFEDGESIRDFVNIKDVTKINIIALNNRKSNNEIFNVGGGKVFSVKYFDNLVRKILKTNLKPNINNYFRYGDVRHTVSDITKAKKLLGWEPKNDLEISIRSYLHWLLKTQKKPFELYVKKNFNNIKSSSVYDCS